MNQESETDRILQFPLHVSPRFLPCLDNVAKRFDVSDLPVRLNLDPLYGLSVDAKDAVFDPENDFLLRGKRAQVFIDRQQAFRVRGWILQTFTTIYLSESLRLSPPGNMTSASNPGRLEIDRSLVRLVQPELSGWSGWLWRIRDQLTGENRFEGSFDWLAEKANRGDARAALVLEVAPQLLIAAYSDEFDCVVGLRFPATIARFHKLQPGDRLVTCNNYELNEQAIMDDLTVGPKALMNLAFTNFQPVIANFVSSDVERLKKLETGFSPTELTRLEMAARDWHDRFRAGETRPRIGAPLWSNAPADDPPLIDVPIWERAVAATIDLVLITILVAAVWWVYFGFDEILRQFLANPQQPAARTLFKEMGRTIRFVASGVFMIYCAIMLASPLQATFGKLLFRMRVINKDTCRRISLLTGCYRTIMLLFGVFPAFWALIHSVERQALHDKAAKTRVVRIVESQ